MATTKWREGNRARWVGTRPAHDGEQVASSSEANNATVVQYTVPAGKVFHLCFYQVSCRADAAGNFARLYVRDAADNLVYQIVVYYFGALDNVNSTGTLYPPLEIPAGYDIVIHSNAAGCTIYSFVLGWLDSP